MLLESDPSSGFTYAFYGDLSYCQSYSDKNILYPEVKYNFVTSKDSLKDRVFLVKDIIDKTGSSILKKSFSVKPILLLEDTLTKQLIYFKYNERSTFNFPFFFYIH